MSMRVACLEYCKKLRQNDEEVVEVDLSCSADNVRDSLSQKELDELAGALHGNRYVKTLILWGNKELNSAASLLAALQQNTSLERVNLALTGVDQGAQDSLSRAMAARRIDAIANDPDVQLATVCDLSQMGLDNKDVKRLAGALKNNISLMSLSLWGNKGITSGKIVEEVINANQSLPLISISLDDTGLDADAIQDINKTLNARRIHRALAAIESGDGARVVNLSSSSLDDKGLAQVAQALRHNATTTSISIAGNPAVHKAGLLSLIELLESSKHSQMCHIAVDQTAFDAPTLARVKAWRMAALSRLLERDSPHLTTVDLSRADLSAKDIGKLALPLSHSSHVTTLNVSRNKELSDDCLRGDGGLISIIEGHRSLTKVNSAGTGFSMGGLSAIASALRKRGVAKACGAIPQGGCTIDYLKNSGLEDGDVRALAEAFRAGGGVYELELSGNARVTDSHVDMLLGATRRATVSLVRLGLGGTRSGGDKRREARRVCRERGVSAAVAMIKGGGVGRVVDLSGMGLDDEEVMGIAEHLWRSTAVCEVLLADNPQVTGVAGEAILSSLQGHSRLNPSCTCQGASGEKRASCRAGEGCGNVVTRVATGGTGMGSTVKERLAQHCRQRAIALAAEALKAEWHPPLLKVSGEVVCLRGQRLTDADLSKLVPLMERGDLVGRVDLSDNPLLSLKCALPLLNMLRRNKMVHTVNLGGTRLLSTPKAAELAEAAAANALSLAKSLLSSGQEGVPSLSFLRGRGLADGDVMGLIKALGKNPHVTHLDLGMNLDITDEAVRALEAAVMVKNGTCRLSSVLLDGTSGSHRAKASLNEALVRNAEQQGAVAVAGGEAKHRAGGEGGANALATLEAMQARWGEVEGDLASVSRACGMALTSLELELRKAMLYRC